MNVLQQIIEHKQLELQHRKAETSLEYLRASLDVSKRSLKGAISQPGNRFILEYKTASPSKGVIRNNFSPADCIDAYRASADAYSVLTDNKYFGGNHERLKYFSEHDDKPVLCKDFFIDPYQIYEARYYGADAILLMLSVLKDEQYKELAATAKCLNLDVLTEVHTTEECERAVALGAEIIGVNNRDLRDLSIDLAQTEKLANKIPSDRLVISESGINSRLDVARLAPYADGFLVGSSLMGSGNVKQAAIDLVYGSIKICGVKSEEVAQHCVESGARYLGLMFYPKSKRFIEVEAAEQLINRVPAEYVGVFVDESLSKTIEICNKLKLKVIQLHGSENLEQALALRKQIPNETKLWKALSINSKDDTETIKQWLQVVDKVVLDYQTRRSKGGNGRQFDWSLLPELFNEFEQKQIVIAGGIMADNISELLDYHQSVLDLSSGVERYKGEKDKQLITALFDQCRQNGVRAA